MDWILVVIRWMHAIAAVAWVGGGIFYLLALRPGLQRSNAGSDVERNVALEFRGLVNTAIAVLLISGVILTLSRLTSLGPGSASGAYIGVLSAKVVLALYMFLAVRLMQGRSRRDRQRKEIQTTGGAMTRWRAKLTGPTFVLICGVVVIGLADVLDFLFERGLAG